MHLLIIQPYVENAIWHGLLPLEERKGMLQLKIEEMNNELTITIEDNGIGREASNKIKKRVGHISLGMELTSQRVVLFGKEQCEGSVIIMDLYNMQREPAGTQVKIKIPKIEFY
jgi:two-component system, LytTR family, sensor kinase